ncbi:hypothetical protein AB4Z09_10835 [Rhodococcus sp. TAF43]|uniref:hypothetical protein n=1 Tax=unclassified Rhodococcus (in: high G+C Gram-positive bacteria) TaxID=192944 RepID=UPI000E0A0516|nr:hypothetical protein [Rhodococcus sp. AG1013]RDI18046.1 hypothetical protein DEU38_12183 [Rhodococcus sp. AG1013]
MSATAQFQFTVSEATALADSCSRLRDVSPDYPRVYAVATMAHQGKRRWWPIASCTGGGEPAELQGHRVGQMYERMLDDLHSPDAAAIQVASALVHAVVGRVAALVVLEGRAWDPGVDNLWIHMDSDSGIDWAGVVDDTLRVLPDDGLAGSRDVVTLPCERALLVWTAHRCVTSLSAIRCALDGFASVDQLRLGSLVADAVLGVTTRVPILAGSSQSVASRRGQGLLDAFEAAGVPVRTRAMLAHAC